MHSIEFRNLGSFLNEILGTRVDNAMNISAKIFVRDEKLIIELPLTNPTGKIRVKRRHEATNYGLPIASRRESFTGDDYIEWQISYATQNPPQESIVEEIVINENQKGFELTKLLNEGMKLNIISNMDISELEIFINDVQQGETLEENEKVFREEKREEIRGGFKKFIENSPLFVKNNEGKKYFVEILLRQKQRAVGLQAMVYLCIYVETLKDADGNSLIGRTAKTREFGRYEITLENKEIIMDVVRAFAIASQQHKRDISNILEQIKRIRARE